MLYREDDRWIGLDADMDEGDLKFQAKQPGLKAWLKRAWKRMKEFAEEHPALFFVAIFIIIIVALCVLI